jgi:integrase
MPAIRLTKRTVEALPYPQNGQILYRDLDLPGFGVRVGKKSKVYFVEGRVHRRTVRATVGRADLFSAEMARRKAMGLLGVMAGGTNPNVAKRALAVDALTVEGAFEAFFEAKPNLSPKTVKDYTRTYELYLADWMSRPLSRLTRDMILARHRSISEKHGAVTANNAMRHLRSVYNFSAAANDRLPPNPLAILSQARAWHRERRRSSLVENHQLPAWWSAIMAETEDARDVLLVALFTGMRRSEILRLKWENLDFAAGLLRLPTSKNGDPLDLPLSDFLQELFRARQGLVGQSEWVFPGRGKTGHLTETKTFVARVSEASGVKFTMHDLRRTFITIAESLDIPAYALKRLLNHRVGADVTGGYIVISADRLRQPVERIAQRMQDIGQQRPTVASP